MFQPHHGSLQYLYQAMNHQALLRPSRTAGQSMSRGLNRVESIHYKDIGFSRFSACGTFSPANTKKLGCGDLKQIFFLQSSTLRDAGCFVFLSVTVLISKCGFLWLAWRDGAFGHPGVLYCVSYMFQSSSLLESFAFTRPLLRGFYQFLLRNR